MAQVGFGEDFQASRDIDNTVNNTFRLISDDLEELIKRVVMPLRSFATGKVQTWQASPPLHPTSAKHRPCSWSSRIFILQCVARVWTWQTMPKGGWTWKRMKHIHNIVSFTSLGCLAQDIDAAEETHKKVVDIVSNLVDNCEARSPEQNGSSIAGAPSGLRFACVIYCTWQTYTQWTC